MLGSEIWRPKRFKLTVAYVEETENLFSGFHGVFEDLADCCHTNIQGGREKLQNGRRFELCRRRHFTAVNFKTAHTSGSSEERDCIIPWKIS
jgi:hypothetical protein